MTQEDDIIAARACRRAGGAGHPRWQTGADQRQAAARSRYCAAKLPLRLARQGSQCLHPCQISSAKYMQASSRSDSADLFGPRRITPITRPRRQTCSREWASCEATRHRWPEGINRESTRLAYHTIPHRHDVNASAMGSSWCGGRKRQGTTETHNDASGLGSPSDL